MDYYYQVMPIGHINESLTYKYSHSIEVGSIVEIPLRKRKSAGVIISQTNIKDLKFDLKKVLSINNYYQFAVCTENIDFYKYVSKHCFIDLGMVLKMAIQQFPNTQLKNYYLFENKIYETQKNLIDKYNLSKKDWQKLLEEKIISQTTDSFIFDGMAQNISLNPDQENIFKSLQINKNNDFQVHLIDGVTGSGKTELYLKAVESNLVTGNQSLILLPEIALTEEWSRRFFKYFGCRPFIWHSKQSKIQKARIIRSLLSGEPCVLVGARSSVLLPFKNLKLVICDEEHDSSYKQEDGPKYQARDMAIYKAKCSKALCLLISASPSLESLHNSNQRKFNIHHLSNQFHKTQLPSVEIVDMNQSKPSSRAWISKQVFDETNRVLKQKGQVLFFLNRRGYAPSKICASCHTPIQCQNCAANLVYHKKIDRLICHHCSNYFETNQICKMCSSEKFISIGIGLERLQEEVTRLFPGYSNQLFSSDTLKSKKNKKEIIENIFNLNTSLLIGSQIIGKSFHFPNLKLVNIVDADSSLYSPDFRAMEKTYQLLQQVAGRSGREGNRGKVLIQTYNPKHSIYNSLKNQSRDQFIKLELQRREENNLPPFYKIVQIQLIHPNVSAIREACQEILDISKKSRLDILGPVPSLIPYKMKHFHENFYFKERTYKALRKKIDILMSKIAPKYRRFLNIDIDPLSIA
ncbi:primosomal protein N' [Alphaproteobacteria bacterium]|nr:primosomal protein N' [Alphaproteobacteria bacterium]